MRPTPKFMIGQWVQIWAGNYEDQSATVKGLRWVGSTPWHDACWEYDLGWLHGCHLESNLAEPRRNRHYDSMGYCDNPARGY